MLSCRSKDLIFERSDRCFVFQALLGDLQKQGVRRRTSERNGEPTLSVYNVNDASVSREVCEMFSWSSATEVIGIRLSVNGGGGGGGEIEMP